VAFWAVALAVTTAVLAWVLAPLVRAGGSTPDELPVDADTPRGAGPRAWPRQPLLGAGLGACAAALAVGIYLLAGTPEALRPARIGAGVQLPGAGGAADPATLVRELESHLAKTPGDRRAWTILARLYAAGERWDVAGTAFARALDGDSPLARDAEMWAEYADVLGMAQGGRLAGAPAAAIERALGIDPSNPRALELAGSAALERGDAAAALRHWVALLDQLPANSPKRSEVDAAVQRLELRSGLMREAARRR
jgi:cytochrome c-type biogenesis protein CcmH